MSGTTEAGVAGVPGALSNLPDTAEAAGAEANAAETRGGLVRRVQTRNWEVDRVTQKSILPAGGIRRVSVAVLLNGKYQKQGKKQVYVPRSSEELATLEAVVKSAVGFDAVRGDVVQIANAEFSRLDEEAPVAPPPAPLWKKSYLPFAVGGAAGLVLLSLIILVWRRRAKKAKPLALDADAMAPALLGVDAHAGELEPASPRAAAALPRATEDLTDLRAAALELANKDPASAAVVLRSWLHGEASVETAQS
jgi:flagellar M-ring protein FliF